MGLPEAGPGGSCYGFDIASRVPLAYLRRSTGGPTLRIVEPSLEGARSDQRLVVDFPAEEGRLAARIYARGTGFRFWMEGTGWFDIDPTRAAIRIPAVPDDGGLRREERLWGVPALLCFMTRGDLPLHAAAVEVDGSAVILAGRTMAGKTTLAAAFSASGHRLLSEDLVCFRTAPVPAVVPGPAMLRLREDVAGRFELGGHVEVGRGGGRVHLATAESARGDCSPVPVRSIVLLERGQGALRFEDVPAPEAIRELWALGFGLSSEEHQRRSFSGLVDLVGAVPVRRLHRPLTIAGLPDAVAAIATHA